nr:MAG TPA: hypothetical protein [Caudoviricetes sp.]
MEVIPSIKSGEPVNAGCALKKRAIGENLKFRIHK